MHKSVIISLCFIFIQLICCGGLQAQEEAGKKRPNIIFILLDDLGYSDLGAYGGEIKTPHMDSLAHNGLRFTQCYNSARCCPSRASLLTGLYSHQAGIANFTTKRDESAKRGPAYKNRLNDQCVTLAEVLQQSGYATFMVGKWHVSDYETPIQRGFGQFYGFTSDHSASQWDPDKYRRLPESAVPEVKPGSPFYVTDVFSDYALEFIKQGEQTEKPFFLYLAYSSPHFPLHAPPATRDKYLDTYRQGWDKLRAERYKRQQEIGLTTPAWKFTELSDVPMDDAMIANGFPGKQNPHWDSLDHERQEDLAYRMSTFAAMVEHVDEGVGKIIEHLKSTGDLDNTLIMITSDNGACYEWGPYGFDGVSRTGKNILHTGKELESIGTAGTYHSVGSGWSCLSNTPLRMYKHFNHEGGNCSPLVVSWPKGITDSNRWVREPVHLLDIMPTLCAVSGAEYPENYHGKAIQPAEGVSLTSLFPSDGKLAPRSLCFDHFGSSAIRKGDWKLVRGNHRYNKHQWELYNISKDRCETHDLIKDNPDKAKELLDEWAHWAKRVRVEPYNR